MAVYVDDMHRRARVGRITANWSHLLADTPAELRTFADRLGLNPEWLQHEGTYREHYDVTSVVRQKALDLGALPMAYPRGTGQHMNNKRATYLHTCVSPCNCDIPAILEAARTDLEARRAERTKP